MLSSHFNTTLLTEMWLFSRPYLSNGRANGMVVVCPSVVVCRKCIVVKR